MSKRAGVPVIPAIIDSLWGSFFSYLGKKVFWKLPRKRPYPLRVAFGRPVPSGEGTAPRARQELLDLGEKAFQQRPELKRHLGRECVQALARSPGRVVIIDRLAGRRELKAGMLLGVVGAFSRKIRRTLPEKRIGIVLPPGIGAFVANLSVLCAGKIPVNLNFTIGRAAIESSLRQGEIRTVYTADAMKEKIPHFPWPENTLDVKKEIESCGKATIFKWMAAAWLLPGSVLAGLWKVPRHGDGEEAGLLFTSGSSGPPKGVPLTHRNILGNIEQIAETGILSGDDIVLACLPVFHSFGFTATLWYPLLKGVKVVTVPSPLESAKIAESIHAEKATLLIGTPTFLRPLLKKAKSAQLQSLKFIVTGAERLPSELADAFIKTFQIRLMQGYGLTETSPVVAVSLPDPEGVSLQGEVQVGNRPGSVGRLVSGMTARVVDPESGAVRPLTEGGILHLKGPNVFEGYLNDEEKNRAAFSDGWFVTGDLARFDEDGFLFIEGRLSRFSKIGGEMVPHGTIEEKIIEVFGWDTEDACPTTLVGVAEETKGETLVLLTVHDVTSSELREKLGNAGFPNLWIPKKIVKVDKIPFLGSGKCDFGACKRLAQSSIKKNV